MKKYKLTFVLLIPVLIFGIGTIKTNQSELCQNKNNFSSASKYSIAFSNQFSGCNIELSRR
ncbi:hypothetical protein BKH42_08795 [Helicobacter sp. 13S00482-2]|uniref:hypothetical protein n=1 Tax=Helicobacter sp. 13S00482-2 TaxID=1476200 RepID=UPI000BA79A5B|nr:hypothetical protein [Helicobacter sp. 13S00482-2]PAF52909.1 hypothetical protein BKH42_08795 [Helicobacter sp. 13S00482-2]